MHKWQQMVKDFMVQAKQLCPDRPARPPLEVAVLRRDLIAEELHEYWLTVDSRYVLTPESEVEQVADAIADLLYVVIGTAVAWGIDIEPIFEAVHEANMRKFEGGSLRADGKYMKNKDWRPADIGSLLAQQVHGA